MKLQRCFHFYCINMYFIEYCAVSLEKLITPKSELDSSLDVQTEF